MRIFDECVTMEQAWIGWDALCLSTDWKRPIPSGGLKSEGRADRLVKPQPEFGAVMSIISVTWRSDYTTWHL